MARVCKVLMCTSIILLCQQSYVHWVTCPLYTTGVWDWGVSKGILAIGGCVTSLPTNSLPVQYICHTIVFNWIYILLKIAYMWTFFCINCVFVSVHYNLIQQLRYISTMTGIYCTDLRNVKFEVLYWGTCWNASVGGTPV